MSAEASSESSICRAGDRCCSGMCEWTDCRPLPILTTDLEPHLSLPQTSCESLLPRPAEPSTSKQPLLPSERFQFSSEENLLELAKGFTPANTRSSTKWALNVFELWKQARNTHHPEDPVPQDLLVTCDPSLLNTHLSKFAVEARKANGEIYPPSTIHQLLCGLLRHMRETVPGCPNFLNKQDSHFCHLHGTLDALFHKLHSNGIGVQVRHTEIITKAEEDKLWDSGVMGVSTPRSLQNAAFFVVGKMFSLRGGVEHRNLKLSQLTRNHDPDHYIYQENVSKTNSGSFYIYI